MHAFQLRIRTDGIRIDGEKAAYQLREYPSEQTPEDLLQQAPPRTGGKQSFGATANRRSERDWLQCNTPSCVVTQLLCPADYAPATAMDSRPPAARLAEHTFLQYQRLLQREVSEPELVIQLPNVLGDYGTMLSESADVAGVEFMELKVIIAFEALRPRCGMHFCGDWALSDNEVGGTSNQCKLRLPPAMV